MMDPKIARALRAARGHYSAGGSVDPYGQINQSVQEIFSRPRRGFQQSAPAQYAGRQEEFGVPSWVNTQEMLRRQAAQQAAVNPQPAAPQQQPQNEDLLSFLQSRAPNMPWLQNARSNPNYAIANGVFQTFRPMLEGLGMGRFLESIGRR